MLRSRNRMAVGVLLMLKRLARAAPADRSTWGAVECWFLGAGRGAGRGGEGVRLLHGPQMNAAKAATLKQYAVCLLSGGDDPASVQF